MNPKPLAWWSILLYIVRETGYTIEQIEDLDYEMVLWWLACFEQEQVEQERKMNEMKREAEKNKGKGRR